MTTLPRIEQYQWATMTRRVLELFQTVSIPFFMEYTVEGQQEFKDRAGRLRYTVQNAELANRSRKKIVSWFKKLAELADNSIPNGKEKLSAADCEVAFRRFLFLADVMLLDCMISSTDFCRGQNWQFVHDWIGGLNELYDDEGKSPEEVWAWEIYLKLVGALKPSKKKAA